MELGSLSVSLSVKDPEASQDFYTKLGFEPMGGNFDETTQGPASFMVIDPDGNPILIDQHR